MDDTSGKANLNVVQWASSEDTETLFISVITVLQLEMGILSMERRDQQQGLILRRWLEDQVVPSFEGRIIPIDVAIARKCAEFHVPDKRAERDAMIAATAVIHRMRVVTKNVADFDLAGVEVINPWLSSL